MVPGSGLPGTLAATGSYKPVVAEEVGAGADPALRVPSPRHSHPDGPATRARCRGRTAAAASAVLLAAGCAAGAALCLAGRLGPGPARSQQLRTGAVVAAFDCTLETPEAWSANKQQWCCEAAGLCATPRPAAEGAYSVQREWPARIAVELPLDAPSPAAAPAVAAPADAAAAPAALTAAEPAAAAAAAAAAAGAAPSEGLARIVAELPLDAPSPAAALAAAAPVDAAAAPAALTAAEPAAAAAADAAAAAVRPAAAEPAAAAPAAARPCSTAVTQAEAPCDEAPSAPAGLCEEYGCGEPSLGQGCHCHPGCTDDGTCCADYDAWCIAAEHAGEGARAPGGQDTSGIDDALPAATDEGAAAGAGPAGESAGDSGTDDAPLNATSEEDDGAAPTTTGPLQERLSLVPEITGKAPPRPSPPVTVPVRGKSPRPASCPEDDPSLPKLLCFAIAQAEVSDVPNAFDELALMRKQFRLCGGVFGCTHYAVFSDRELEVGPKATSWTLPSVSSSQGGGNAMTATWVNMEVFKTAWQAIVDEGTYLEDDFVVKADPDAVLVPTALQGILHKKGYSGERPVLFRNCPGGPRGLELFGSLEVVSRAGVATYAAAGAECQEKVEDAALMGEDMWLQECMDAIGVQSVMDVDILHDAYCSQDALVADMCIDGKAAYHPFKVADEWAKCFGIAVMPPEERPKPRSEEDIAKEVAKQEEQQAEIIAEQQAAIEEQEAERARVESEQQKAIKEQEEAQTRAGVAAQIFAGRRPAAGGLAG